METSPGNRTDVILGGGYLAFKSKGSETKSWDCPRKDGRDLIEHWKNNQKSQGKSHKFITDRLGLQKTLQTKPEKVLGIFSKGHLSYEYNKPETQPKLYEMTHAAIGNFNFKKIYSDGSKNCYPYIL